MSFQDLEAGRRLLPKRQQEPSQAVAAGIFKITTELNSFKRLVESLGTPKDSFQLRDKLQKSRKKIGDLVKDTSTKLKQTSEIDRLEANPGKKVNDAKLAREYKAVLNEFQKFQRLASERETMYSPFAPKEQLSSRYRLPTKPQHPPHKSAIRSNDHYETSVSSTNPEQQHILMESRRQEVIHLENEIAFNETIIEEREEGIREIQKQIKDVNEIFKDLSVLVQSQGEMIDEISSNVDNAHGATEDAVVQLAKASKIQRSNSSLSCLLLVIFGIVLIIVVIVTVA